MRNPNPSISKKVKALNAVLILGTLIILIFEAQFLSRAQGVAPSETAAEQQKPLQCSMRMLEFIKFKQQEFAEFMNTTFRQPLPTSELISSAIERLRQYRTELENEAKRFAPPASALPGQAIGELKNCASAINAEFKNMAQFVRSHVLETAYAKKTTLLLSKYKEMNEKLSKLNFTIGQMFGYFGSFAQQLTCFATQCTKG